MAMTLLAAVRRAAPEAVALLSPKQDMSLTYGELDDKVRRLAGGLRTLGVGRGHVVASDLPNTAGFVSNSPARLPVHVWD
eukprot:2386614-Rhodomonas_salina.1